ncbi:MAG: hypothetical protein JWO37_1738 [Acidimicrobiales bacterium]|nr:hypothetical protein [Acidimicrobiales bacterium]
MPKALERVGGLQAQYAPAMYLGLWSRVDGFARDDLTNALETKKVAQGTLQRATIHVVSKGDYWPFAVAIADERRRWWLAATRNEVSASEMGLIAKRVRARLHEQSPITRKDIDAIAGDAHRTNGVNLWLDLLRVPPSGTWDRRRADIFAAGRDWLGPPPDDLTPEKATAHVVKRYLEGYGPATVAEIANWAGLKPTTVTEALGSIATRTFEAENGDALVDLPRAPLPDPDTPAPVRFLPVWDATLLAHARRALVIKEEDRTKIFSTKTPHSLNTVLVDGQVAGTWHFEKGKITFDPFGRLDAKTKREVTAEADRLAAFHN